MGRKWGQKVKGWVIAPPQIFGIKISFYLTLKKSILSSNINQTLREEKKKKRFFCQAFFAPEYTPPPNGKRYLVLQFFGFYFFTFKCLKYILNGGFRLISSPFASFQLATFPIAQGILPDKLTERDRNTLSVYLKGIQTRFRFRQKEILILYALEPNWGTIE